MGKQAVTVPSLRKNDSSASLSAAEAEAEAASPPPLAEKDTIDLTVPKEDERENLHPNSKEWSSLHKEAKLAMGGIPPSELDEWLNADRSPWRRCYKSWR